MCTYLNVPPPFAVRPASPSTDLLIVKMVFLRMNVVLLLVVPFHVAAFVGRTSLSVRWVRLVVMTYVVLVPPPPEQLKSPFMFLAVERKCEESVPSQHAMDTRRPRHEMRNIYTLQPLCIEMGSSVTDGALQTLLFSRRS